MMNRFVGSGTQIRISLGRRKAIVAGEMAVDSTAIKRTVERSMPGFGKSVVSAHSRSLVGKLRRLALRAVPVMLGLAASPAWSLDVVYAESNSPAGNSILSFENDGSGRLRFLGSTAAGGIGVFDPSYALGPFDSDQNLFVSRDQSLLFAVNSGSNSIAVFHIDGNGSLTPVSGSPFPSGGIDPVSVGLRGDALVVVNKDEDPHQNANLRLPNYTTFRVDQDGGLEPINGSTVPVAYGSSPSQASIAAVGPFVFGADFFGGLLQSFQLDDEGRLLQNPPQAIPDSVFSGSPAPHWPLGLTTHPSRPILYANLVAVSKVAVYRYSEEGRLKFVRAVADPGAAPCWVITNHPGTRLYVINTGTTSVAVYDLKDPLNPRLIQHFQMTKTTGNPFSAVIDDSDQFIYVSSEQSTATADASANAIYTLKVASDGTLSEPFSPTVLPIDGVARAQGVAVFSAH
jgi:6-phosphogluconolactonase (cycloisomerase 2 family)